MNCRFQELLAERKYRASDLTDILNIDISAAKAVYYRGISTLVSAVKYATALHVPLWEMFYDCGKSAIGYELPEWDKPCAKPLRIDELMKEHGMTQAALAEKVGIASSHLSKIFHQFSVQINKLDAFIDAFGLQGKEYLLFVSEDEYRREVERRTEQDQDLSPSNEEEERSQPVTVAPDSAVPSGAAFPNDLFAAMEMAESKRQEVVVTLSDGRKLRITIEEIE